MSDGAESNNSKKQWMPDNTVESKKLSSESGFNLAGAGSLCQQRTRGKRVLLERRPSPDENTNDSLTTPSPKRPCRSLFPANSQTSSSLSTLTVSSTKGRGNLQHSRVIVECSAVRDMMEQYISCPQCQSAVKVSFPTCCIASGLKLSCTGEFCTWADIRRPAGANIQLSENAGSALIERNTDYALNILCVTGFLISGDGCTETSRLLGLLGLPSSTTMWSSSFHNIEQVLSPEFISLADEVVCQNNLREEVRLTLGNARDENDTLLCNLWLQKTLAAEHWPRILASTDMGWQGRSSGVAHNSLSGHALHVGQKTRKPIAWIALAKSCSFCKSWHSAHMEGDEVPEHECVKNHDGTSGSMEPVAALKMHCNLYENHQSVIETTITDDDSSIKAKLKWCNADHMLNHNTDEKPMIINSNGNLVERPDHGEVPRHMPEPIFLVDPNHRKKTLKGDLCRQVKMKVKDRKTLTLCDCVRLATNFAHMARALKHKTADEEIVTAGKAALEHHFDNHEFCGDWCARKKQTNDEAEKKKKHYRCKEKDAELHKMLQGKLARFVTLKALKEVSHGFDTNVNESFNNTAAWIAPKNKVHSTTNSLRNRIGVALGTNGLGCDTHFEEIFRRFGIVLTDDIRHYIHKAHAKRVKRLAKNKTPEAKKKKLKNFHQRLKDHTEVAKKERAKRDGLVCRPGIGMADGYISDTSVGAERSRLNAARKANTPPRQQGARRQVCCSVCKAMGHNKSNKNCPVFPKKITIRTKNNG